MEKNYNYNGDFSSVVTILDNKNQVFINALCITNSIKHAALEIGVSEKCVKDFMGSEEINYDHLKIMRKRFKLSNKQVKLQFKNPYSEKKTNSKNN
jgi:hypothetical protein